MMLIQRERGNKGKNIKLLWHHLANNIKLICFTKCVSKLLFCTPNSSKLSKAFFNETKNVLASFNLAQPVGHFGDRTQR